MNQAQKALAEEFAIGICLSETAGLRFDEILDALGEDRIPEGVVAWEPFEWQTPNNLAETITDMESVLRNYAEKLIQAN